MQEITHSRLTNIPTIYLETKGGFDFVDKDIYTPAKIILVDGDSTGIFDAEIKGRGNSTWEFMEKKPFRIKFSKKQNLLGLPANAKNWTLIACAVDKTLLRNSLAFELSRSLGFEFSPSNVMVDVFLDGFYYGAFMASDHLEVDPKRINIDEMSSADINYPEITGGYHLEIDAYAEQEPVYFKTNTNVPVTIKSPDEDEIVLIQKEYIRNHIINLENRLFQDTEDAIEQYIDLQTAVKYYLHSELTGNCDSYWSIHTFKKRNDDKLYFGPVWDFDQAFLTNERVPRDEATLDQSHGVVQHWFRQLMKSPTAKNTLKQLWEKVIEEDVKEHLINYLIENSNLIQQSQALNFERWRSLDKKVWFEDALFPTYAQYIEFVAQFIEDRFGWFDENVITEKKNILPESSPENPHQIWRYTEQTPSSDWYRSSFDDSGWLNGTAPFGTEQNLQNTLWNSNQIYIRTKFHIDKQDLDNIHKAYFKIFHDEDCWIYLNDELALQQGGYLTGYKFFEFEKALLKEGWNTLSVKCIQSTGGQLIDVGVYQTEKASTNIENDSKIDYRYHVKSGVLYLNDVKDIQSAKLMSIDGKLIQNITIVDQSAQINLPHRGQFLVRLADVTLKISN
ncbi:MAG: CotH kinase family protein [Paludibacteraceae bacterium]